MKTLNMGNVSPLRPATILVVDDQEMVRVTIAAMLSRLGFRVRSTGSSHDALHMARWLAGPIDLLLSDVLLPDINGPDLADAFVALRPECRVLFVAGYSGHPLVTERILPRGDAFLAKPFLPHDLEEKVREALAMPRRERVLHAGC